jgi:hypothetical protein
MTETDRKRTPGDSIHVYSIAAAFFAMATFLVSLSLPALFFLPQPGAEHSSHYLGIALLLLGWIESTSMSTNGLAWLANPFFALGLLTLLLNRPGLATVFHGISCGLSSVTFNVSKVCIDEAGNYAEVVGYGPGFWLWYSTILVSCVISLALFLSNFCQCNRPRDSVSN